MKKVHIAITVVTLFLAVFQSARFITMPQELIIAMFLMSPFVMLLLVLIVLKYGEPSKYTFDDRFYDDHDYKRNGTE
jgi:RsiW-degrading membrane proteinase PrsW (M82 family)